MQEITIKQFWVKRSLSGMHYSLYDQDPTNIEHIGIHLHINAIKSMNIQLKSGEHKTYCTLDFSVLSELVTEANKTTWQKNKKTLYNICKKYFPYFFKTKGKINANTNIVANS